MYARARWPLALRWVAAALVFESALSFRQRVYVVHQDKLGIGSSHRSSSSPLPSVSTLSSLHTRSSSTSTSITSATSSSSSASNRRRSSPRPDLALDHERRRRRIRINRVTPQTQPRGGSLSAAAAAEDAADVSEERGAPAAAAVAAHSSGAAVPPEPDEARQVSSSNPTEARTAAKRHYDGDFLMEQKLESAKAAILCGGVGAASRLLAVGVGAAVPPLLREALATPEPVASAVLFGLAAGFVQGALFGLTYRYVVRSDREAPTAQQATRTKAAPPQQMDGFTVGHLGDGCVAAFALTSALGQSEVPLSLAAGEFAGVFERGGGVVEALAAVLLPAAPFLPRAAAGLLFYSIARTAIDRALDQGAIKPFP